MKKCDIKVGQVVTLDGSLYIVIDIADEIIIEAGNGKRQYASAGSLKNPTVILNIRLPIKIMREDEYNYYASCPPLKGFHTRGADLEDCLKNAQNAGEGFIESVIKHYNMEGWIRVKDELPSGQWNINHPWLTEEVLIANSCSISIGYYNRRVGMWYVDKEWIDEITHWMPLPPNPND